MYLKHLSYLLPLCLFSVIFCFGPFDPNNPTLGETGDDPDIITPPVTSDTTLLAHWDFNDSGKAVLEDYSTYKSHGIISGCKWVQGIKGYSLYFDGIDDYVEVKSPEQLNVTLSNFTVSLFVKFQPDSSSDTLRRDIISKGESCASGFGISVQGEKVLSHIRNQGCTDKDSTIIKDGKWHHIVLLRREGKGYVYFDKASIHNFNCNDTVYTSSPLRIGVNSVRNEGYFSGCIDEIKIIKSAWTQSQIEAEYNRCY